MIPEQEIDLTNMEIENQPSLTYRLDFDRKRIGGKVDNEDAIMQMVMKILYTERYAYVIYSSNYGVELERMVGKDYDFIVSDLERTIKEALLVDDRILDVVDFETVKTGLDTMTAKFKVISILGDANIETEVNIL
jgi:hypothetical protein